MKTKMTMIYWKGGKFWLGKLLDHPEVMTQGETLEELEENMGLRVLVWVNYRVF